MVEPARKQAAITVRELQPSLGPELLRKLGRQDQHLLVEQWDMLRHLTGAIERYIEDRLSEPFEHKR